MPVCASTLAALVNTGCIVELPAPIRGWHSNIFLCPKKSGSFRMILNLKPLNKLIKYRKSKMPNTYTVMNMVKVGDHFISLDLENAYSSLQIRDRDCRFLQFSFENKHYMYPVLPNGTAIGPWVFVEVTKALTRYLRKRGVNMVIYIDDTLLINKNAEQLSCQGCLAKTVFLKAGFVVNKEKSVLTPCTRIEFLDFNIDSVLFTIELTVKKTAKALKLVQGLLTKKNRLIPIKTVACVIGTLVAVFPA